MKETTNIMNVEFRDLVPIAAQLGIGAEHVESFAMFSILREIAAQLAELNEKLSTVICPESYEHNGFIRTKEQS